MRATHLLLAPVLTALTLVGARDASACGGCLHPPTLSQSESTVVTGHRMVLSLSNERTTLWDQITYSGEPKEFAWVLPIHGEVEVGLSSNLLFDELDRRTQVSVRSPDVVCTMPAGCGSSLASENGTRLDSGGTSSTTLSDGEAPPVTVTNEKVVGPYETVQLASKDPGALQGWLADHGYEIPPDIAPVIAAYVSEGFGFLALKLIPGAGIRSMRPVRVTFPGASPTLPLRMVAAGTGATTAITLWVLSEGRYEPTSAPSFQIESHDLLWNWDTASSSYAGLKHARFAESGGKAWLIEAGESISPGSIAGSIASAVNEDPWNSGYGSFGVTAGEEEHADVQALIGALDPESTWITRLHAELSREALATDLTLGASLDQSVVRRSFVAPIAIGTPPACPDYSFCATGSATWPPRFAPGAAPLRRSGSCAMTEGAGAPVGFCALGVAAVVLAARRRRGAV